MSVQHLPSPVDRKLMTPGIWGAFVLMAIGLGFAVARFTGGLSAVTNLDNQHPWGLWIAIDVASGVALAAGGFTSAALVYVFHRKHFHSLIRPALLTALLGYTFVALGLMIDLGKPYNIWHPMMPSMWSPNSVLFEVGICVMIYLTVLFVEFSPIIIEKLGPALRESKAARWIKTLSGMLGRVMFVFIIAGVVLSCAHQSSLGALMVIAPSKMHPLWWSPMLPLLFLLSAIAVGFPMIIFESIVASRALKLPVETDVLGKLAKFVPAILAVYLSVKIADLLIRDAYVHLAQATPQTAAFALEILIGVLAPMILLFSGRVRRSTRGLLTASILVVAGVVINRINVFLVAFQPNTTDQVYFPSIGEIAITISLFAGLVFFYRLIVTYFPVITQMRKRSAIHEIVFAESREFGDVPQLDDVEVAMSGTNSEAVSGAGDDARTHAEPALR